MEDKYEFKVDKFRLVLFAGFFIIPAIHSAVSSLNNFNELNGVSTVLWRCTTLLSGLVFSILMVAFVFYTIFFTNLKSILSEKGVEGVNALGKSQFIEWNQISKIKNEWGIWGSYIYLIDSNGKKQVRIPYSVGSINEFNKKVDEFAGKGNPLREYLFRYVD